MSTTAIRPNGGTPFEQFSREIKRVPVPIPAPKPRVVVIAKPYVKPEAPSRSLQQRLSALQHANDVRSRRSQLKRDIKAGRETVSALLLDPPPYLETAKVFDVMMAVPKLGHVKVNNYLRHCRISPSKTIGGLSQRQRNELVETMGAR